MQKVRGWCACNSTSIDWRHFGMSANVFKSRDQVDNLPPGILIWSLGFQSSYNWIVLLRACSYGIILIWLNLTFFLCIIPLTTQFWGWRPAHCTRRSPSLCDHFIPKFQLFAHLNPQVDLSRVPFLAFPARKMSYQQRKLTRRSSVSQHRIVPPDLRQYVPLVDRDKTVKRSTKSPNRASGLIHKLRQGASRFKLCLGVLLTSLLLFSFVRWRNEVKNERHRKIISIAQDHMHDWMGIKPPPGLVSSAVGRRKFLVKDWQWVLAFIILGFPCNSCFNATPCSPHHLRLYRSWNEIRQEIENALLLATLLDRELVLPAFVYASACQYEMCVSYVYIYQPSPMLTWHRPIYWLK